MGKIYKRIICLLLAILMISGTSATVFAEETEEQSLEDIIRPQIEAFAKSIDQKDANKKAQDAIITHGISGNGKKLSVGADHAFTATIMNSELGKIALTKVCSELIETSDEMNLDEIYFLGGLKWKLKDAYNYYGQVYDINESFIYYSDGAIGSPKTFFEKIEPENVSCSSAYDDSLEILAGGSGFDMDMKIKEKYNDKIVYNVSIMFVDFFDFSTENSGTLENLLGFIGLLLFEPFWWEAKVEFQIEIPNDCEHSFGEWKTVKDPSCTEKGSEERTCPNCGCVDTKETAALGHSFGEWSETKAPTYTEEGEEQRICSTCGAAETRPIAALDYLLGDINGDESINVLDANLVRRYSAMIVGLDEKQLVSADVNGDGKVNVVDANLIRRFAAKLIDAFPNE